MRVRDLIKAHAASRPNPFTPTAHRAVKAILEANAAEPNRLRRVSAQTAVAYLWAECGYTATVQTFRVHVKQAFGRGWEK